MDFQTLWPMMAPFWPFVVPVVAAAILMLLALAWALCRSAAR
jgi:hypothetical protein